jgi:hypothetical protein
MKKLGLLPAWLSLLHYSRRSEIAMMRGTGLRGVQVGEIIYTLSCSFDGRSFLKSLATTN